MVKIEFRKIIGFGNGGYVVSLPRRWIGQNNLKKGDILNIDETNDELTFSINGIDQKKEDSTIVIEAEDKDIERIKAEIVAAYLNNFNTIEIISKRFLKNAVEIKNIVRNLAGLEIMEQTSTRLVAKDLININDISILSLIRRMDNITRGMMEDVLKCIEGDDHYESIFHRDIDVNRLYYLITRVIKRALKDSRVAKVFDKNPYQLSSDELVGMRIEKIADRQKRIARFLMEVNIRPESRKELKEVYQKIKQSYYDVMKSYYTNNKELAFDIELSDKVKIKKFIKIFMEKNTGCNLNITLIKNKKIDKVVDLNKCVQISKISENLNGLSNSIKYIARTVLEID